MAWMSSWISGCSVRRPVCASVLEGFVSEWEPLPGWKLSSVRGGPRLQAGSRQLRFPRHSGFVHFWSVSRVRPPGSAGEARKRQWAHSPGLAPRVGTSGSSPRNIFPPLPLVSHIPAWVRYPVASMTRAGLGQRCPSSERKDFVLPVVVVANVIITITVIVITIIF